MVEAIITAAIVLGAMGLIFGIILGIASKVFQVDKDERVGMILQVLPCANCGGCGFAGCTAYAEAVVAGKTGVGACTVGGSECSEKLAEIMGTQAVQIEKKVARVKCIGNCENAPEKYNYVGVKNCLAALRVASGPKSCSYGCLGIGSCTQVCPTEAIKIKNGVAFVNETKCIACGRCIEVCPRRVIELVPAKSEYMVACNSEEKGSALIKSCSAGCIGCGICVKVCENQAIEVEDHLAKIDADKCTACGLCSEKCPRKVILKY